jgi:hypothetical protein
MFLVGCGGPTVDPNRPKTYPVKGVVTYKGEPVEGATVMFMASGSQERGAIGKTDTSGGFALTTFEAADGALPGPYRVTVSKTVVEDAPEEVGPGDASGAEPFSGTAKDLLPTKYKDANKSGLTAEVKETGDNSVTFDLTD